MIYMAYDLDGVICPDINMSIKSSQDLKDLFETRLKLPPIFVPKDDFIIITGRPIVDADHTFEWFQKYNIKPKHIFFNLSKSVDHHTTVNHKVITLQQNQHAIKGFVESDKNQVEFIRTYVTQFPIYHFSEFVKDKIHES